MARVHKVEKARKDNPAVKKGEPYYWWQLYKRAKQYSAAYPKRSQLTGSDFLSQMYDIEDDQIGGLSECKDAEDLGSAVENICEELRSLGEEAESSRDNMPEGLQEGDIGQMLESRYDECESMADELESVDLDDYDEDLEETKEEWLEGKIDELQCVSYNGE